MGALAPEYFWNPQDDVLLKNAIEAGASLESLAKGAVQFSQRFSIQQLQERWHSLLYDPVVSQEASARMIEVEHSSPKSINIRETQPVSGKRKPDSIRKSYYSLCKRICNDPFTSTDLNFINPPDSNDNINSNYNDVDGGGGGTESVLFFEDPIENQFRIGNSNLDTAAFSNEDNCIEDLCIDPVPQSFEENLPFDENQCTVSGFFEQGELGGDSAALFNQSNSSELEYLNIGEPFNDFGCADIPIWDTVDGICVPDFPCINFDDEEQQQIPNTFAEGESNSINNSAPSTDEYLAELKNSLLDLENEDEFLFMDADGKDTVDRSMDTYHSLLLGCPNESETTNNANNVINFGADVEVISDKGNCNLLKPPILRHRSSVNSEFPELRNGVICCVLSTEDQEIPCNDDVFLINHIPSESSSPSTIARWKFHDPELPTCTPVREYTVGNKVNDCVPKIVVKRERNNPVAFPTTSHIGGPPLINRPLGDREVKLEMHQSSIVDSANMDEEVKTEIVTKDIGCNNSIDTNIEKNDQGFNPRHKQDVNFAEAVIENCAELGPVEKSECEVLVDPPTSQDQEAASSEVDEDEGVPCFSDVEAMILDMGLSPDDDWSIRDEIMAKYQDEETQRKIIRLECCADAAMQRSLLSEGAFAVLYGHASKHFIKKPEVLLGRSTEDFTADIDIGGHNSNRISRRQAFIKLDNGGSFHVTNLGSHSIFVNGSEVTAKQSLILPSGCLIDIRGIYFVFETCRRKVEEYLNKLGS